MRNLRNMRTLARQRGVAVITALLLTTLAVTIVASLFWQQQVQVRSMENQRLHLQTKWILRGALELSTLILKSRFGQQANITSLDQVWATPLAETRLDQYIERDRVEGEVFDATLSGGMLDATARYNLTNLSSLGTQVPEQVAIFARLLANLRIDPALAAKAAKAVADADVGAPANPGGAGTPPPAGAQQARAHIPVRLTQVDDLLAVPGYTKEIVDKLREFVIVLPEPTPVNVNTAPAEVLSAHYENLSVGQANALVEQRKKAAFLDEANLSLYLHGSTKMNGAKLAVQSNYFLVRSRIRLDRAALDAESLINLNSSGQTTVLSVRQI
jgi:general secretion pathway protein K